jgi:hypothetical protein
MANNTTIPPEAILNPYTPLAFLPPHIANQYQAMCYMYVATLSVSPVICRATIDLTSCPYRLTFGIG